MYPEREERISRRLLLAGKIGRGNEKEVWRKLICREHSDVAHIK